MLDSSNLGAEKAAISEGIIFMRELRDNWSEEIPDRLLHGGVPEDKYFKVRGNWFQGVVAGWESLKDYAPKTAPQLEEIEQLKQYFCNSPEFASKMAGRVDFSDIEKGNRLIGLVLELFSEK